MKIYFAGCLQRSHCEKIDRIKKEVNILGSFFEANNNKKNIDAFFNNKYAKLRFIDSGAYSAFTRGIEINIDDYIDFITEYINKDMIYANLDIIGDWEATEKNQRYMESKGLNPLPTFHYGTPLDKLKEMIKEYDYIALGGLVPLALQRKKLQNWLDVCFSIIKTDCKVHGFGVNSFYLWKRYPFFSVDATSWLMGEKFRRVIYFEGNELKIAHKKSKDKNIRTVKSHIDKYYEQSEANILTYIKLADKITKLWEKRGIIWKD